MQLVKPSFHIINQEPGKEGMLRHIEKCGRTCYKSEDKITDDSAPKFVDMLINRGHTAVLEHGTVYLRYYCHYNDNPISYGYDWDREQEVVHFLERYESNPYTNVAYDTSGCYAYITTNYRVLLQNNWLDDLQYQCEPTEHHSKRVTVRFVCDRGITAEYNRHRVNSVTEMSTRYVAFDRDKFGGELSIIHPCWITDKELELNRRNSPKLTNIEEYCQAIVNREDEDTFSDIDYWLFANLACEYAYLNLRRLGWQAQQARTVLPLGLRTELVHTATIEQWEGFFKLRCAKDAHPQARELAIPLRDEFVKLGYITPYETE